MRINYLWRVTTARRSFITWIYWRSTKNWLSLSQFYQSSSGNKIHSCFWSVGSQMKTSPPSAARTLHRIKRTILFKTISNSACQATTVWSIDLLTSSLTAFTCHIWSQIVPYCFTRRNTRKSCRYHRYWSTSIGWKRIIMLVWARERLFSILGFQEAWRRRNLEGRAKVLTRLTRWVRSRRMLLRILSAAARKVWCQTQMQVNSQRWKRKIKPSKNQRTEFSSKKKTCKWMVTLSISNLKSRWFVTPTRSSNKW